MTTMSRAALLRMISNLRSMKEVEQAQAVITKQGLYLCSSPPLISKLIAFSSLSPQGNLAHALSLFEETPMEDPFVCSTIIRAYSRSVFPIKAILVYNQMHRMGVEYDEFTYNFALKACARTLWCTKDDSGCRRIGVVQKAEEIHCRVIVVGFNQDRHIQNSLLHVYAEGGHIGVAQKLFDEMSDRTVASWNIMISAFDSIGDFASSDNLFQSMPMKNVVSWNTLITRHIRLRNVEAAKKVFDEMPERDSVSWNSMIAGYILVKDFAAALNLFREMEDAKVEATEITLISIVGACAETSMIATGRKIHESLKEKGHTIQGYMGIALVDMYAKCGNLNSAWGIFNELGMRPVSCWNAMIVGLALHGYSQEALELFHEMKILRLRPDRVTFIGVLIACSHKGLVNEGRQLFKVMVEECGVEPDMKHYGCMVDLLSRWGLLDEALEVIREMPFGANCVVWRTLLGACRVHGNVEMAELSIRELRKLEPLDDGDYVLLSNSYAEAGRWEDVERLRDEMVNGRVLKVPGFSLV